MRHRDPQFLGNAALLRRMEGILAARNITPGPVAGGEREPGVQPPAPGVVAGVPERYRGAVVDHPQVLAWVRQVAARALAPNPGARRRVTSGPSLLLAGVTGAGKTHLAYGAVRALAQAGIAVRWRATTAADLYAALRPRPGVDTEVAFASFARVPLLLLDDLGAARGSEWVEEITYRLVNYRYNAVLPTLITANLRIGDLRATLGDRVASRLAEMTVRVKFEPVDRRRAAA